MKKTALIFPGQGVQKSGMGLDLYENSKSAKKVFETANKVLGYDVDKLCFEGSEEELTKTIYSQPCIVTVEIAALEALREQISIKVDACAGHSLGEYSALYASGVIDLETVFKLIQKRAELMSIEAERTKGAMAAVIGLDIETVEKITDGLQNVYIANYNSPSQVVITGEKESLNNSLDKFKAAGAKRVIPLAVSGAFHSPYMKNAGDEFSKFVNQYEFNRANISVYTNVDALSENNGEIFRKKLPLQIYSSVHWVQTINNMMSQGIMNYMEVGPGKVLSGLNKKISADIETKNISDWESLISCVNEVRDRELV